MPTNGRPVTARRPIRTVAPPNGARPSPPAASNRLLLIRQACLGSDHDVHAVVVCREVVEPGEQIDRAVAIAREMLQCSPIALAHTIANARLALDVDEPAAIAAIPAMAARVQSAEDFVEGIASFLERRPARFTGRGV